jgi:hypothetical protein
MTEINYDHLADTAERLGVTDDKEKKVVDRLVARQRRKNEFLLSGKLDTEEFRINDEALKELEGLLKDFGREDLVQEVDNLAVEDYGSHFT